MLNKLAFKNAHRLWKDYLTYFATLCMITALMSAFHSLLFSKDIYAMLSGGLSTAGTMLVALMSVSTIVILIIVGWLIHYMTRFILEKRSREFAIYLLSGMKKQQLSDLYIKENSLLAICALIIGLFLGSSLKQALFFIFYKSLGKHYKISLNFSAGSIFLTIVLYTACFIIALFWNKRKFSRMEIIDLLTMNRQNEPVSEKRSSVWKWCFVCSVGNIFLLYFLIFSGAITKAAAGFEIVGLIFTFYFFYLGLSAFLMRYIKNKGSLIYKREALFLMRQFSSKIKNTCFVLGTLSLLFTFAIVGSSLAFMLSDYQNKQLNEEYPFDIIILSDHTENKFIKEEALIKKHTAVSDLHKYCVYQNQTRYISEFLYQNLKTFSPDTNPVIAEEKRAVAYYEYDIYMGITDYNYLRKMLGYMPVDLQDNQFLIHMPNRVYQEIKEKHTQLEQSIPIGLDFAGYKTEGFAQAGHNGADYLLIVPDKNLADMKKCFSLMAVMAKSGVPEHLSEQLYTLAGKIRGFDELGYYIKIGSEELFLTPATIQVKSREVLELKFLMSTLSFPLFYIGFVFLLVSLTVLSVQQLSDTNKYKFRYQILHKIGVRKKRIKMIVAKQLFFYYLCPVIVSVMISAIFVLYLGRRFVNYTGIHTMWFLYFVIALVSFLGIYLLYLAMTYIQFMKSIEL